MRPIIYTIEPWVRAVGLLRFGRPWESVGILFTRSIHFKKITGAPYGIYRLDPGFHSQRAASRTAGMAGDYRSVPEGIVLCATIVSWSYILDWFSLRSSRVRRLLEPPPIALVRNGSIQRRNLRREMISQDELMSNLRVQGIEELGTIKVAFLEPDGEISVIKEKPAGETKQRPQKKRAPL